MNQGLAVGLQLALFCRINFWVINSGDLCISLAGKSSSSLIAITSKVLGKETITQIYSRWEICHQHKAEMDFLSLSRKSWRGSLKDMFWKPRLIRKVMKWMKVSQGVVLMQRRERAGGKGLGRVSFKKKYEFSPTANTSRVSGNRLCLHSWGPMPQVR